MSAVIFKAGYKNLIVYQKALSLSVEISKYVSTKRYSRTREFIIVQLLRSVSSIGANIAEGYGRHYQKSYRQFLSIARGSCFETDYWLEVVLKLKMFDNRTIEGFIEKNKEIAKMLTSMMKKLEHRA